MNDPNGMFYYNGYYHLFFQYYPDGNVWGSMHWTGHAISTNMVGCLTYSGKLININFDKLLTDKIFNLEQ